MTLSFTSVRLNMMGWAIIEPTVNIADLEDGDAIVVAHDAMPGDPIIGFQLLFPNGNVRQMPFDRKEAKPVWPSQAGMITCTYTKEDIRPVWVLKRKIERPT